MKPPATDNEYERSSQLARPGVFRLNIGVSTQTFQGLFGPGPVDVGACDFAAVDTIMLHPDYAAQHYVVNPGAATCPKVG